ncbi:histidine kinase [Streptomyces sp. NPDC005708]|uniref:PAS domain-containing sensor histidine kinase n=1 Tax=Streptomyces sp. NPDC005708 TaxID=3154564 RepID=UPI0033CACAAD
MIPIRTLLPHILDSVPQAIWVVAPDGRILYTNPAAVAALGYGSEADLLGRPSHETLHPYRPDGSLFPASECPMLSPARTGKAVHGDDGWFMRRDGSFFPTSWWSAPISLPGGVGVVYSFFDATELRRYQRVERDRVAAGIRAAESRAAQRRIIESVAAVRRRTSRDLHDGAQQRLVSLLIGLRLAREVMTGTSAEALGLLDQAADEAQAAVDELRELAAGIYPSSLTSRGLSVAVCDMAARCPIPVRLTAECERRLPAALEANAYFLVAEAVTNAVKHAKASRIDISIRLNAELELTVADDGVGGVVAESGSGLFGLYDRVAAYDGSLTIESPMGVGTIIVARLPVPPRDSRRDDGVPPAAAQATHPQ